MRATALATLFALLLTGVARAEFPSPTGSVIPCRASKAASL